MTKRSAKRQPDNSIAVTLANGTAITLRPVYAGDVIELGEDENMLIASLVTQWGDRKSIMSAELSSRGFLDGRDALFLKQVVRKLLQPDLEEIKVKTLAEESSGSLVVTLPSGSAIELRYPDGCDLERVDFSVDPADKDSPASGLKLAKSSLQLAALLSLVWGKKVGTPEAPAVTYETLIKDQMVLSDDLFAIISVVSEHFFRVEGDIEL